MIVVNIYLLLLLNTSLSIRNGNPNPKEDSTSEAEPENRSSYLYFQCRSTSRPTSGQATNTLHIPSITMSTPHTTRPTSPLSPQLILSVYLPSAVVLLGVGLVKKQWLPFALVIPIVLGALHFYGNGSPTSGP